MRLTHVSCARLRKGVVREEERFVRVAQARAQRRGGCLARHRPRGARGAQLLLQRRCGGVQPFRLAGAAHGGREGRKGARWWMEKWAAGLTSWT
jgi:hypothetical protein